MLVMVGKIILLRVVIELNMIPTLSMSGEWFTAVLGYFWQCQVDKSVLFYGTNSGALLSRYLRQLPPCVSDNTDQY